MAPSQTKLIPVAVLVAILGYLAWTHFEQEPPSAGPPSKLPEIANDLLRPAALPITERDPFGKSVRFELGETSDERPVPGRKGNKAAESTAGNASRPGTAAAAAPAKKLSPAEAKIATKKAMSELVLNATLLYGDQKIAMINGRAYQAGERLGAPGSEIPLRVAEIHHHRVVLEHDGKLVDLTYSDKPVDSKAGAARTAGRQDKTKTVKTGAKTGSAPPRRPGATPRTPQTR